LAWKLTSQSISRGVNFKQAEQLNRGGGLDRWTRGKKSELNESQTWRQVGEPSKFAGRCCQVAVRFSPGKTLETPKRGRQRTSKNTPPQEKRHRNKQIHHLDKKPAKSTLPRLSKYLEGDPLQMILGNNKRKNPAGTWSVVVDYKIDAQEG